MISIVRVHTCKSHLLIAAPVPARPVSCRRAGVASVSFLSFQHFARYSSLGAQYLLNEQMLAYLNVEAGSRSGQARGLGTGGEARALLPTEQRRQKAHLRDVEKSEQTG